ncbi:hypothetical protein EKH57_17070 [Halorubrum sp. BOL3-1]|uniref:hypothetical protein n=1 Tax=Halorubrum sp. BOL3-1 TaxID=2497325 RepID=UPI001004FC8F|nr:hypothetical protein [Halorubrum sp. BOL3-1]QAU14238.1 hypothetical protein EKH57_17070 [Halorubrum sp. BOL3-1]
MRDGDDRGGVRPETGDLGATDRGGDVADFLVMGPDPDVSFGPVAGPGGTVPPGGTTTMPEPTDPSGNETDPSGNASA